MIDFFEHIPSYYRTAILVAGLVILWLIEGVIPRLQLSGNKYKHAGTNLFFTLTTAVVNLGFAFLIVKASEWTSAERFGVLYLFALPAWLHAILALLLLDFIGAYLVHVIQHKIGWMWHFHKIHHTDTAIDATTALRHHPIESIFRVVALFVAIVVAGVPIWMVMLYQTISAFMSQFNHANIHLPHWLDKGLSWIIVDRKSVV